MKKYLKYLYIAGGIIVLVVLIVIFLYQLFKNNSAEQSLSIKSSENISENVKINCYFGSKKTISGKESGLIFSKNDFDSAGNFVSYIKNEAIQDACGIKKIEIDKIIDNVNSGGEEPRLFDVILVKNNN